MQSCRSPWWHTLAVAAAVSLLALGLRPLLGLSGALGTDAALWGLTARDLIVGAPPLVPPLFPALLAPAVAAGASPIAAGQGVAALSTGVLAAASHRLAVRLGGTPVTAALAAVAPLLLADTGGWAVQLQPDATAAAWGVLLALAAAGNTKQDTMLLVVLGGLAPLLREHGLVWAALSAGLVLLQPGRRHWALGVPILMWLSPLLVGVWPGLHPLDVPWSDRAGGALSAFSTTDPTTLSYLRELHREERAQYAHLVHNGLRLQQLGWHITRSLRLAPDGWLIVAATAGLTAWLRDPRLARAAVPALAALPAWIIWSQRRHVLLIVPVVLVVAVVGSARLWRFGPVAVVGALLIHGALNWPGAAQAWQTERFRAAHYTEVGDFLIEHAPPGSLLGGVHQDIGLYGPPMPRHDPDGTPADWSTFFVGDRPPPDRSRGTWHKVFQSSGPYAVFRLDPDREPRPCEGVMPAPHSAHLAVHLAHADLPGCQPLAPR